MNDINNEILSRLSSKSRIRSLLSDVSIQDLEKVVSRMQEIANEKHDQRKKLEADREAKKSNIEEIKRIMEERGLSLDDFESLGQTATRKRRVTQKMVFEYETETGERVQWSGSTAGRLPREFQDYLNRTGKKRADCAITDDA